MTVISATRGSFSQTFQQRGATLLVALIMLVLLTLVAVSAVNSTTGSIRVVGNAQFSGEAEAAAQQGIEWVISNSSFATSPAASSVVVDINNDGTPDYTAQVSMPECLSSVPLTYAELTMSDADKSCYGSAKKSNTGMVNASGVVLTTQQTACFNQTWDVRATVTDNSLSGASRTLHQGVALRVPAGTACP